MPPRRANVEVAARKDLRALPPEYRNSGIARAYLEMARRIDSGVSARDTAQLTREMRLCLLALYELAPARHESDPVDELKARREDRMQKTGDEQPAPVATGEN